MSMPSMYILSEIKHNGKRPIKRSEIKAIQKYLKGASPSTKHSDKGVIFINVKKIHHKNGYSYFQAEYDSFVNIKSIPCYDPIKNKKKYKDVQNCMDNFEKVIVVQKKNKLIMAHKFKEKDQIKAFRDIFKKSCSYKYYLDRISPKDLMGEIQDLDQIISIKVRINQNCLDEAEKFLGELKEDIFKLKKDNVFNQLKMKKWEEHSIDNENYCSTLKEFIKKYIFWRTNHHNSYKLSEYINQLNKLDLRRIEEAVLIATECFNSYCKIVGKINNKPHIVNFHSINDDEMIIQVIAAINSPNQNFINSVIEQWEICNELTKH